MILVGLFNVQLLLYSLLTIAMQAYRLTIINQMLCVCLSLWG